MPRFLVGDELGYIKSISCSQDLQSSTGWKVEDKILFTPSALVKIGTGELEAEKAKDRALQRLSISHDSEKSVLAAAQSDGTLTGFSLSPEDEKLEVLQEWKDPRYKAGHAFVGLDLLPQGLFWCTSNGALGLAGPSSDDEVKHFAPSFQKASLPMRLCAWRLSPDTSTFAYGGNEVDLSVWDTERAFQNDTRTQSGQQSNSDGNSAKKRKRGGNLFPAEIWRAKNLPNDSLSLRQPIHITSLSYLPSSSSAGNGIHIVTGTENGDVRRYDTRAARRPVATWIGIAKVGGVGVVQAGLSEHELFVADNGTSLSALDLRNGRTIYSYKKLQGAVTSLASSSGGFLGSTSRDRFFRFHTTFPPPNVAGSQQDERGEVISALYMKSVPTAVVSYEASGPSETLRVEKKQTDGLEDDDDVWAGMKNVDDSDEESEGRPEAKRQS